MSERHTITLLMQNVGTAIDPQIDADKVNAVLESYVDAATTEAQARIEALEAALWSIANESDGHTHSDRLDLFDALIDIRAIAQSALRPSTKGTPEQ